MLTRTATPKDIERFMAKVDQLPNGCWVWLGARSKGGDHRYAKQRKWYGSFWFQGKVIRAHRFSCEQLADPPRECPPMHDRDHTCRFSLCVNPDHIEVVTKEQNQERKWV